MNTHLPRKRFGQHFLHDQSVIHQILAAIAAIAANVNDHWIEIGPGQGALTFPMLKQVKQLEAIELDRDLIPILEKHAKTIGELILHEADVLTVDFKALQKDQRPLKIFGNLPYNISTPLIFHLLSFASIIDDMVFMVQKEVAERLAAIENDNHYGRLSVMAQYFCKIDVLFYVPPSAFTPPPKVDSSIIRIRPFKQLPFVADDYDLFANIVKQAFGQRRKTLRNSLKTWLDSDAWHALEMDPMLRPENISVETFVKISNYCCRLG